MTLTEFYVSIDTARAELARRWADTRLREHVLEYLGGTPPGMGVTPVAYFSRTVLSPTYECARYLDIARSLHLRPSGFEYLDDRFVSLNYGKRCLLRMPFMNGQANGNDGYRKVSVAYTHTHEMKPFRDIVTLWGEPIADFHHRLLTCHFPMISLTDESTWLRSIGTSPAEFYNKHLARFLVFGIQVESYLLAGREKRFVEEVFVPNYRRVVADFDLAPLIVRLLPQDTENGGLWSCYPSSVERVVDQLIRQARQSCSVS